MFHSAICNNFRTNWLGLVQFLRGAEFCDIVSGPSATRNIQQTGKIFWLIRDAHYFNHDGGFKIIKLSIHFLVVVHCLRSEDYLLYKNLYLCSVRSFDEKFTLDIQYSNYYLLYYSAFIRISNTFFYQHQTTLILEHLLIIVSLGDTF